MVARLLNRSGRLGLLLAAISGCTPLDVDIYVTPDADKREPVTTKSTQTPPDPTPAPRPGPSQYEVFGKVYTVMDSNIGYLEIGIASWYGRKFHGRLTAMGEVYDMYEMTAAHKSLPLPTVVKVTNLDNARSVVLRVNDRGPFHDDRLIDLSYGAARALGFENKGTAPVVVEALDEVNHPELAVVPDEETYYLQAGAFQRQRGASRQLADVQRALPRGVPARILTSELDNGDLIYKVWIGPISDIDEELLIEELIVARNLGRPIRVTVE